MFPMKKQIVSKNSLSFLSSDLEEYSKVFFQPWHLTMDTLGPGNTKQIGK